VIDYTAQTVLSAGTRTWIHALVAYACSVSRAIRAEHALWSATDVRIAKVLGYAGANAVVASSVGPAG